MSESLLSQWLDPKCGTFLSTLAILLTLSACGGGRGGSSTPAPAGPAASIAATSGTPQSAIVNTAFAAPFVATVKDANGNPVSGVRRFRSSSEWNKRYIRHTGKHYHDKRERGRYIGHTHS
jgi:hypothetical protein